MELAVLVAMAELAVAALACAWLAAPSLLRWVNRLGSRAQSTIAKEIVQVAEGILPDAERALDQLSAPEQLAVGLGDVHRLVSCRRRLEGLLTRAACVAGRSSELLVSPRIACTRSAAEVTELLRINADHIAAIRAAADDELREAECWIDRSWAATIR